MFAELWKDFLRRFWWGIAAIVIVVIAAILVWQHYNLVTVSGYQVSKADAVASELYQKNNLSGAEAAYQAIVKSTPNDWFAWNGLANVYRDENKFDLAEADYKKAIAINPKFEAAYQNIYNLYYAWSKDDATKFNLAEPVLLAGYAELPKSEIILQDILDYYSRTKNQDKFNYYQDKLNKLRNITPSNGGQVTPGVQFK